MGVQERRAREKQELRQEIVDAARDLFVREGFDNVSMRKIAEKIEYSPTTIYLYFLDKADLLDCIVEETFQRLEARMAGIHESIPDPRQRLIEGLRAYIDFGIEHPSALPRCLPRRAEGHRGQLPPLRHHGTEAA